MLRGDKLFIKRLHFGEDVPGSKIIGLTGSSSWTATFASFNVTVSALRKWVSKKANVPAWSFYIPVKENKDQQLPAREDWQKWLHQAFVRGPVNYLRATERCLFDISSVIRNLNDSLLGILVQITKVPASMTGFMKRNTVKFCKNLPDGPPQAGETVLFTDIRTACLVAALERRDPYKPFEILQVDIPPEAMKAAFVQAGCCCIFSEFFHLVSFKLREICAEDASCCEKIRPLWQDDTPLQFLQVPRMSAVCDYWVARTLEASMTWKALLDVSPEVTCCLVECRLDATLAGPHETIDAILKVARGCRPGLQIHSTFSKPRPHLI